MGLCGQLSASKGGMGYQNRLCMFTSLCALLLCCGLCCGLALTLTGLDSQSQLVEVSPPH